VKIDRETVYQRYKGHCAYCGMSITIKQMQIDHFWPQCLAHHQPSIDSNRPENLMPSCQKCNIHKHGMRPEFWRHELEMQVSRLNKNPQFDRALRFGQIQITKKPILFYFEIFEIIERAT
jgi:hypothetical protein